MSLGESRRKRCTFSTVHQTENSPVVAVAASNTSIGFLPRTNNISGSSTHSCRTCLFFQADSWEIAGHSRPREETHPRDQATQTHPAPGEETRQDPALQAHRSRQARRPRAHPGRDPARRDDPGNLAPRRHLGGLLSAREGCGTPCTWPLLTGAGGRARRPVSG